MKSHITITGLFIFAIGLSGCTQVNTDWTALTHDLSGSAATQTTKAIKAYPKTRRLTHKEKLTLAWLGKNQLTWRANGQLQTTNWYDFWTKQVRQNSVLANAAYHFCKGAKAGSNCQTFWQAYSMANAELSQQAGQTLDGGL